MAIQQTSSFSGHHGHSGSMHEPSGSAGHALKDQLQQRLQAQIPVAPPVTAPPAAPGGSLPLPVLINPNPPQPGSTGQIDYGLEPYNPPPIPTPTYKLPAESSTQGPADAPIKGIINQPPVNIAKPIDIQAWNTALGKISSTLRLELLSPKAQLLINQQADKNPGLNTQYALGLQTPVDGQNLALVGSLKEIMAFLSVKDNAERFVHMLNPNASVTLKGLTQRYDQALNTQADLIALNQTRTFLKDLQTATMPGNPSFEQLYPNLSISTVEDRSSALQNGFLANQRANQNGAGLNQTYIFEFDYPVLFTDGKTRSVAINLAGPLESLGPFIERGGYSWLTANGLTGNQRTGLTTEGLVKRYETAKASTFDPSQRSADQTGSTVDTQLVKPVEQLTLDDEESTIPKTLPFGSDKSPFISVKPTDPDQQNNTGVIGLQPKDTIQPPKPESTDNINNSSDPIKASTNADSPQSSNTESTETDTQPDDWVDLFILDAYAGMEGLIRTYPKIQQALFHHVDATNEVTPEQIVSSIARGQHAVAAIHQIRQNQTPEILPNALAGNQTLPETPLTDMQAILRELLHGTGIKVQEAVNLATQHWSMHPYELAWDIHMQSALQTANEKVDQPKIWFFKNNKNAQTAKRMIGRAILGYAKTIGSNQVDTRDLTTAMYFNGENISVSGIPLDEIVINGAPLTKASLVSLFGVPDNSKIIIENRPEERPDEDFDILEITKSYSKKGYIVTVTSPFIDKNTEYYLFKDTLSKWHIVAGSMTTTQNAPLSYASHIVAHMLQGAKTLDISNIITNTGRGHLGKKLARQQGRENSKNMTGYYTWPAYWGANAEIPHQLGLKSPFSLTDDWQNYLDEQVKQRTLTPDQAYELRTLQTLVQLTAIPEGRRFWRKHGTPLLVSVSLNSNDPLSVLSRQRAENTMQKLGIRIHPLYGQQITDSNFPGTQKIIKRTIISPNGEIPINIAIDYKPQATTNTPGIDALNPEAFDAITRTDVYRNADPVKRYRMGIKALGGIPTWRDAIRLQRRIADNKEGTHIDVMAQNISAWISTERPTLEIFLSNIFHEAHPIIGHPNDSADFNHSLPRYLATAIPDINNTNKYNKGAIRELKEKETVATIIYQTAPYFQKFLAGMQSSPAIAFMLENAANAAGLLHNNNDKNIFQQAINAAAQGRHENATSLINILFQRNYKVITAEDLRDEYAAGLTVMHLTGADKIRDIAIHRINPFEDREYRLQPFQDTETTQTVIDWTTNTRLPSTDEFEAYYNQIRPLIPTQAFEQAAKEWNIIFQYRKGELSPEETARLLSPNQD